LRVSRAKRNALWTAVLVVVAGGAGAAVVTKNEAHKLLTNPRATRYVSEQTPSDRGLPFEDVSVTSADGTVLRGWFIPADSPRLILVQHGYKDRLQSQLGLAELFHRRGYQVMLMCVRAHDRSDGEQLYIGQREMPDMEAWSRAALARPGVDPSKVGMFGVSMGGSLAIQYTATHGEVKALVADSAFSSLEDTIDTSVKFFTGLPPFPFGPMIRFWAEREGGFEPKDVDAKKWIAAISPRPVLIMQGGADRVISVSSGQKLFDVAREPKEFWFEPSVEHGRFLRTMPAEFERRVVGFFDRHLQ
jgi:alpha-beta hydrolase superfamily lysophospholipase